MVRTELERLGEGQGFLGDVARVGLELDRDEAGAPRSLIAKLPTSTNRRNRGFAQMNGAYEREIRFYQELAGRAGVRTPRLYYGAFDPTPWAEHGEAVARFFARLPFWLLHPILRFLSWLSGFSPNRYVLLLEDLAPARVGDQVAGIWTGCWSMANGWATTAAVRPTRSSTGTTGSTTSSTTTRAAKSSCSIGRDPSVAWRPSTLPTS